MSDPTDSDAPHPVSMRRRSVLQTAGAAAGLAGLGITAPDATATDQSTTMPGPLNLVTDVEQDFDDSIPDVFAGVSVIPLHSRIKYEYRQDIPGLVLDRVVPSEVRYPGGYGFIPQTNAGDGDPLDILILLEEPLQPGVVLDVRPVAVLRMTDDGEQDDKIVAAPVDDARFDHIQSRDDITQQKRDEIEEFFKTYKNLGDDPDVVVDGFGPQQEAYETVAAGAERFSSGSGGGQSNSDD